jgi:hypothetical protein
VSGSGHESLIEAAGTPAHRLQNCDIHKKFSISLMARIFAALAANWLRIS